MGLQLILMALNNCIEGGLQKFQEEGGLLSFVPTETPILLVYHPSITVPMKNSVTKMCAKFGIHVIYVTSTVEQPDEETFDIAESNIAIMALCKELNIPDIALHGDPLHIGIGVRGEITQEQAEALSDGINKIVPWATRIFVVHEKGFTHKEYAPVKTTPKAVMREVPQRSTVISEDDILNLIIAMESSKSLEDFLAKV